MLQKCQERTKSRAHPPWPTRGEGWGSMRSRVVAMYDDGSDAHAAPENLSSKRGATIGPARDRQHGGFGRRQVPVFRTCITLGKPRRRRWWACIASPAPPPDAAERRKFGPRGDGRGE